MLPTEKLAHQALMLRMLIAFIKTTPCHCPPNLEGDVVIEPLRPCKRCELLELSKPYEQLHYLFTPEPPTNTDPSVMDHP